MWEEQDSNLRRFPNGFTVRPRWPLEYLPLPQVVVFCNSNGANIEAFLRLTKFFYVFFIKKNHFKFCSLIISKLKEKEFFNFFLYITLIKAILHFLERFG